MKQETTGLMLDATPQQGRWEALLRLQLRRGQQRTCLVPVERYGPLSVQRPFYPDQDCCHVYLLHPPGGVVGGDRLTLIADINEHAHALMTAPGAAKFYLSAGDTARVNQSFTINENACLEYLPQENIYFPGARVSSHTRLDLQQKSRLIYWEKHCFGRPANNEFFSQGRVRTQLDLFLDQQRLFTETQRIDADEIRRTSGMNGQSVSGSLLAYGPEQTEEMITALQQIQPERGMAGLTRPLPELLIARFIGPDTRALDDYFRALWQQLRPGLLQRAACPPRIWNT